MKDRGISNRRVELKNTVIHQRQITGQHYSTVKLRSKIAEEGNTVETYRKKKDRRRKEKAVLPTGGGEATKPVNTEALYASVRSWGI